MYEIAVLRGDYTGPEMMAAGLKVLQAASNGTDFAYRLHYYPFGGAAIDQAGQPLPKQTLQGCQNADAILLSAIGGPKWNTASASPEQGLLQLRQSLGLFANLRPTVVSPALASRSAVKPDRVSGTDFVIVRELTSGIYFGQPRKEGHQEAYDTSYYSYSQVERILRVGFEMAEQRRHHVTVVDKANVLATSRLWRKVTEEVNQDYPNVKVAYLYVDAAAMKIVTHPTDFDVIITANLFGDILSDEASVLPGSLGVIPSASFGASGPKLYEPIHGSAPDLVNQDRVNPISMINSIVWMLKQSFHRFDIADQIERAVEKTLQQKIMTADLGGTAKTSEVTKAIIANL